MKSLLDEQGRPPSGSERASMEVTDLPLEIWQKEKSNSNDFYREAARFIYKRPRHGPNGEGAGWWCRCGRVMRSLIGILHGSDARLKEFQDETHRQLSVCKLCVISYVENRWSWLSAAPEKEAADRALKAKFLLRLDEVWIQPPAQDAGGKSASMYALLEMLLDLDYCLDQRFADKLEKLLLADRAYVRSVEASSLLVGGLKRPPLGLYALCLSPATACREWSKEMVPVHAPITSQEDLDHVNVLFTDIVSRFVAGKSAKGEQNYADRRADLMQHLSFWQGLKFIISLIKDDLLRQFLVKQPGVVELLFYGGNAQGSAAAKEVLEIFLHLLRNVGYKFWLAQDGNLPPSALTDYLSRWYHQLSVCEEGSSLVLQIVEPLLDSLAAFHPSTVSDVYEAILTFLAKICEPMSAWTSFKGYQYGTQLRRSKPPDNPNHSTQDCHGYRMALVTKPWLLLVPVVMRFACTPLMFINRYAMSITAGTALAVNEKLARKLLITVALKGYETLQPDVPSKRVDWIRVLFSAMREDSESLEIRRLFRALLVTSAKNTFFSLHGQLGPGSQLPKPIEPEKENIHDIEPHMSMEAYPWNAVAGLIHRGPRASKDLLVMELGTMLDVLQYVHFVDPKTDATASEKQRSANSMMEVIQGSLGEYFTKITHQLRTRREILPEAKELVIPKIADMVLCANAALLQKTLLILQHVLEVDVDSQNPSALSYHLVRHKEQEKILGGFRDSIALLNQLDTGMTMGAVKVSYLWLALLQQSCQADNMLVAQLRRQLGREETCNFIKKSLTELPPLRRLKAFESTVSKVVVNVRKIWSLVLFEDSRQRHSTLLCSLLAWGSMSQVSREWTNTVEEIIGSYGPGDEECENQAAGLMENAAVTDQQQALLAQKYPTIQVQTNATANKTQQQMGNSSSTHRPAVTSGNASVTGTNNAKKQLTKMERLKLQMQHKMIATGSKMAVQAATTNTDLRPKVATASKTRLSASFDRPLTGDILAQKQQNETLRERRKRIRNIEDLHQAILQIPIPEIIGKKPNNYLEVEAYPSEFQSSEDYSSFWEPLVIEETKASIGRSYLERQGGSDDKRRAKFMTFRIALPPEKRDHFVFFTAELADERAAGVQSSEEMPTADDLVLLQLKKDDMLLELVAFVTETTKPRGGNSRRFTLKLCHEILPFSPGNKFRMATLTTLTTHQRQYEALWKAGDIQPRLLASILRPGTYALRSKGDPNQVVRTMCPLSVRRLLRKYDKTGLLNNSQLRAVTEVAASTCNPSKNEGFTLLQGPPGTGKTSTILALLSVLLAQSLAGDEVSGFGRKKAKILVCAPSNAAVDEILVRVMQKGLDHWELDAKYVPRLLRVGTGSTKDEVKQVSLAALQGRSAFNSTQNESNLLAANVASRNSVREQLDQLNALISTTNSERKLLRKQMWDHRDNREEKQGGEEAIDASEKDNEYEANLQEQRREKDLAQDRKLTDKLTKLHNQKDNLNAQLGEKKRDVDTVFDEINRVRQSAQDELVSSALLVFTTLNSSGHYALRNMKDSFD